MPSVNTINNIAGVILAGGQSNRMGHDKALLIYQGRRLIDHMALLLQETGITDIYVSGHVEGYHCITDRIPHKGPLSGIYSISNHPTMNRYTTFLIVPIDMPLLTPQLLLFLLEEMGYHDAVYYTQYPFPVILQNSEKIRGMLSKIFNNDTMENYSMKHFLHTLRYKEVVIPHNETAFFINANTPTEWDSIKKQTSKDTL